MKDFLSKFQVIAQLSRGVYNEILLVRNKDSETLFLLKHLIDTSQKSKKYINQKKRFKKEVDIVSSLNHKNISKLADSYSDGEKYSLIYPYRKGKTLAQLFNEGTGYSTNDSIILILQLLQALEYIHSRGIIHCDINPNNIFITDENELELFDFGLAMSEKEASKLPEGLIIGTLPYVSPEQIGFTDFKIDTRTDLFCAGIILYRFLSGKHPFPVQKNTIDELLDLVLKTEINPIKDMPSVINSILLKSLKPTPEDRYQTATGFKHDIQEVVKTFEGKISPSFQVGEKDNIIAVNRGKLFVGRETETQILENSFKKLRKGQSSAFVIYGISGIGKTEIVQNFSEKIDEKYLTFLSSKCNRFTSNQPFSIFREIVLEFIAKFSNQPKEFQDILKNVFNEKLLDNSGIICEMIHEMESFFAEIKKADKVEEEKEADRLLHVLSDFLKTLCDIQKLVIFVDDVQWIDGSSLHIFKNLLSKNTNFIIIFNYRTVSADQKDLYVFKENLRDFKIHDFIYVTPFANNNIKEFIISRFGEIKYIDLLADILSSKTDCSPFTLTEALRYLVNNSILKYSTDGWYFNQEDLKSLPQKFDPVSLILEKYESLSESEKKYLELASLIEGNFDREIIENTGNFDQETSITFSHDLENHGFISRKLKGGYSFTHDKIQESISSFISKEDKFQLYEKLAEIYESRITSNKEYIFSATECYLKSRNIFKSIDLSFQAAKYAVEKLAFDIAIRYFKTTAFMVLQHDKLKISIPVSMFEVQKNLGDVLMLTGHNKQALNLFLQLTKDFSNLNKNEILELKYKIGSILHNMGEFEKSIPYFKDALYNLNIRFPNKRIFIIFSLIFEIFKQIIHAMGFIKYFKLKNDFKNFLTIRILNKLSYSLYFYDTITCFYAHLKGLNYSDCVKDSFEKSEAYIIHGVPAYQMFLKNRAFNYNKKALNIAQIIHRRDLYAFGQSFCGILYYFSANWKDSKNILRSCIRNFNSIGDISSQIVSFEHIWKTDLMQGLLNESLTNINKTIDLCKFSKEKHFLATGIAARHYVKLITTGYTDLSELHEIDVLLKQLNNFLTHTHVGLILLQVDLLQNNLKTAYERAKTLLRIILRKSFNSEYTIPIFSFYCELITQEISNRKFRKPKLDISDRKLKLNFYICSIMHWFSCLSFPAYWGEYYRNKAWFKGLNGKIKSSKKYFQKAIQKHHSLDMKYEEAKSIRDFGLFLEKCNLPGEAKDKFNAAYKIFDKIGAKFETDRLKDKVDSDLIAFKPETVVLNASDIDTSISNRSEVDLLRMDTLFDISTSISTIDDIDLLLTQIVSALIKATGAQNGFLFLEKSDSHESRQLFLNFRGEVLSVSEILYSQEIIDLVQKNRIIMLVKDGAKDERLNHEDNANIRSVLCIPLQRGDNYLGCVYLSNDIITGLFTRGSEKAATILTSQAGILIENAYLMDNYKKLNINLQQKVRSQTKDILDKNKQLEGSNLKLMESERMKDMLTGTLVHDIKNYAAGIEQNIRFLNRKFTSDQIITKSLGMMETSCKDIVGLSSNLLDIGRMEEGKLEIKTTNVKFKKIRQLIEKYTNNPSFDEKNVKVALIPPAESFDIIADPYILERIFQNLFNNASKYTPENGEVVISFECNHDNSIISIFNTGNPIPDEFKISLFEKYSRVGSKRSTYSKGLGLYFCKIVMIEHKGKIWVDTDKKGNFFKLMFPKVLL